MTEMGVKITVMIIGSVVLVSGNVLLIGMAWGSLRARLNQIVDSVQKMSELLEKHDDKIDALDRAQVGMKKDTGSAFRQIDDIKDQLRAGG